MNQDETEPAVVGFFDADRGADQQKVYEEVAEGSRYDFRFALVTDEAARTAAKLQKGPAVLVYAPPRASSRRAWTRSARATRRPSSTPRR